MSRRSLGGRLRRFFFEVPEEEPLIAEPGPRPASEPGRKLASVEELAPQAPVFSQAVEMPPGQPLDVKAVYAAAGIEQRERFTAEEALEMIRGFPAELALDVRRSTVRHALRGVGRSDREILQDAAEKIKALESYLEAGRAELDQLAGEAEGRIADLERQIADWRQIVEAKRSQQEQIEQACNRAADELAEVIDFFTPDVPVEGVES